MRQTHLLKLDLPGSYVNSWKIGYFSLKGYFFSRNKSAFTPKINGGSNRSRSEKWSWKLEVQILNMHLEVAFKMIWILIINVIQDWRLSYLLKRSWIKCCSNLPKLAIFRPATQEAVILGIANSCRLRCLGHHIQIIKWTNSEPNFQFVIKLPRFI